MICRSFFRLALAPFLLFSPSVFADWIGETSVYLTPEKARSIVLNGAETVHTATLVLNSDEVARIEQRLKRPLSRTSFSVAVGKSGGQVVGYAMMVNEIGKFRPITFMVGITPDGRVSRVVILVYRESRGMEVRHRRFLRQFRNKSSSDRIRINHDIINVTGATLSVIAVTKGVKKALAILEETCLADSSRLTFKVGR